MTNYTKTRISPLSLGNFGGGHWQYVDMSGNKKSPVGPVYKTKMEALADLEGYSRRGGWVVNYSNRSSITSINRSEKL